MRRAGRTTALRALAASGLLVATLSWAGCAAHPRSETAGRPIEVGTASWYGPDFHGRPTASGETYDMYQLTAAHRTLPFGTRVVVVNRDNGRSVTVRVNDRGPFVRGRIVDLSYGAARELGMVEAGLARVELYVAGDASRAAGRQRFTVQAGAFRDADRAARLKEELARRYRGVALRSEDGWHRVVVGSFHRHSGARSLKRDLERRGYTAIVVEVR